MWNRTRSGLLSLTLCSSCTPAPEDTGSVTQVVDTAPCASGVWYADVDGDGWGLEHTSVEACERPAGMSGIPGDCDDGDAEVHPEAAELPYDGVDQDCDGWDVTDLDGDGLDAVEVGGDDCDDQDASIGLAGKWYSDDDGDGFGNPLQSMSSCEQPAGWVADALDCDDGQPAIHPGAEDVTCDGVDSDCDGAGEGSVAVVGSEEFVDLQMALDEAPDGGEVLVCPGTWLVGDLQLARMGVSLSIRGWSGTAEDTVLTGGGVKPILHAWGPASLEIEDITFEQGKAGVANPEWGASGGAIFGNQVALTLRRLVFTENTAANYGGAVAVEASSPNDLVIDGCLFQRNEAARDGGALAASAAGGGNFNVAISDTNFVDNVVRETSSGGAAAFVYGTGLTLERSTVEGSLAGGAAIDVLSRGELEVRVSDSTFNGNNAGLGALHVDAGSSLFLDVSGSSFVRNVLDDAGAFTLSAASLDATFDACSFENNRCGSSCGGGLYASFGSGQLEISDSSFDDNYNASSGGGALRVSAGEGTIDIVDTEFLFNDGEYGAVYVRGTVGPEALVVTLDGAALVANQSHYGVTHAGGLTAYESSVESIDTDWGTGAFDNDPTDMWDCEQDFGVSASFTFVADSGNGCVESNP